MRKKIVCEPALVRAWFVTTDAAVPLIAEYVPVALFDEDYTAYIRRRMPPGHSCCYSWCGPIRLPSSASCTT